MAGMIFKLTGFYERLPELLRKHQKWIWMFYLVCLAAAFFGLIKYPGLKLDMALESWFRKNDEAVVVFNQFRENFGSDDAVYIVYKAKDGDVFSDKSLNAVRNLQNELEELRLQSNDKKEHSLDRIVEITSLINASYMEVDEDTLVSRDFVGKKNPSNVELREKLRQEALTHKDFPLFYLSEDSQYGGIFIRTDFGTVPFETEDMDNLDSLELDLEESFESMDEEDTAAEEEFGAPKFKAADMTEYAKFVDDINQVVLKSEYTDVLEFHSVGNPIIMHFFNYVLNVEMSIIWSITLLIIVCVLYYLFRSFSAVIWPITLVIIGIILTLGIVAWVNMVMSMMISLLVMLILVVGVADSIHILSGYLYFRKQGYEHEKAMGAAMKKAGFACMLTSLTTSAGLLAMMFVPIPPIARFGISAAIGVMMAFILSVTLLPLLMDLWKPITKKQEKRFQEDPDRLSLIQRFLRFVEPYSYSYPKTVVVVFLVLGAFAFYGLTKVKVNSNMMELIKEGNPVRNAQQIADTIMGGTQSMEITLDMGKRDALKDPRVLNAMDEMQNFLLNEHPGFVIRANSLVNVVKNSFQVLNQDDPAKYIIPQDRKTLWQTLFLFDSANEDDRKELVTDSYDQGRIAVRLKNYGSIEYLPFFNEVQKKADEIFSQLKQDYPEMNVSITGGLAMMMKLIDYMSWSQIQSFGLALIVITIMLLFVFGSPKVGLMGMIPNLFPVLTTFGAMGFLDISLDADTLIIDRIVIGIAVDDTIHFLTHFRTDYLETGDVKKAIIASIHEVGQAISFSTVILVLGFLALIFSSHLGMAHFGYLTAVAFVSALVADLLLLPSLCVIFSKIHGVSPASDSVSVTIEE